MLKSREIADPGSCLNKAHDDEPVFVLLGRDRAAPYTIRCWANERIRLGKNAYNDSQITEALTLADDIEAGLVSKDAEQRARAEEKDLRECDEQA